MVGSPTGAPLHTSPPAMPLGAGPPAMPTGRYRLGSEIARGGMGRVVDADDTLLGRKVAFKEALTRDADTLKRFERERQITAQLEHASIVPVHDAGASSSGSPFYVMRKVSGQPLERLVAAAETLGERLALIPHIIASAHAIAHAHERRIVHRDIKPSNILVGDLGETVVIDWGLAKFIGEPDEHTARPLVDLSDSLRTRAGIVYGTPGFMAPEQLRGAPVTEGCDVYALGATLYHLLARKPPHYAHTADEMMKAAVAAPPTPIGELVEGVPPELATIVDKALAHDPEVRYQNARELAEDLQRFLTGQLIAAHHYTWRQKIVRFIRRNRGVSAALAALVVIGTLLVIRIVIERNRADEAAARAIREAESLTLAQARSNVETNPTLAIAMLKPLATKYWHEVRGIAAAARAAGVAWGIPVSRHTASLEMSRDGRRALSAGDDGVVRLHDLVQHATRTLIDLHVPVMARFADREQKVVAWHSTQLAIVDVKTGARRDVTTPRPVADLEVIGNTAYWIDDAHALWQLDLAGALPAYVPLEASFRSLAPSPDGQWIALTTEDHLYLYDRTQRIALLRQVAIGQVQHLAWSADGEELAVLIAEQVSGQLLLGVTLRPSPRTVQKRSLTARRQFVATSGGHLYAVGDAGIAILTGNEQDEERISRKQLSGAPVGLATARGGTVVSGATGGITLVSEDGDHMLPLHGMRIDGIAASPRSPYVIAQSEGQLLVWNLDEIQPVRLGDRLDGGTQFATSDRLIIGGTDDRQALAIDVATRAFHPLGEWKGLASVSVAAGSPVAAILDGEHHVHLLDPARTPARNTPGARAGGGNDTAPGDAAGSGTAPGDDTGGGDPPGEDAGLDSLPGEIDIAGFATAGRLVLATLDGAIFLYDLASHRQTPLLRRPSPLLGLAWGRGRHPWIAAAFLDGTLWRKNMVTGAEATVARAPALQIEPGKRDGKPPEREGKLIVGADGTVMFLHGAEVHAWRAGGSLARVATAPRPIEDLVEAGPAQLVALADDNTIYTLARDATDQRAEPVPSVDGTAAAIAPDTGMLVVIDHGAVDVVDPLTRQTWTLAAAEGTTFSHPAISTDGRRVVAQTLNSLLMWSLDLPGTAADTAKWLDAMTNAVEDRGSGTPDRLAWR
ncbi:MAG TPA: serine/threonine-protein kinase [Kofleriaceae bacterium]|nr:serine/threonine-protein kinase [Kofleriaceae bacterium]